MRFRYWWDRSPVLSKYRRTKKYGSPAHYHIWRSLEGTVTLHDAKRKRKHFSPVRAVAGHKGYKHSKWWHGGERRDTHGTIGIQSKRLPKYRAYKRKRQSTRQLLNEK